MSGTFIDYDEERERDLNEIRQSPHPRKVVVAGPGTGKSYLFRTVIEDKKALGKKNFLAITFIGRLCDSLADDLAGLAETNTMHGFAREFVLKNRPEGWEYYPSICKIIKEDLRIHGNEKCKIGDIDYEDRTDFYRAIGDDDVVHYAVEICKKDGSKIPIRDLILIDEFQDFNEIEDAFISLLAEKNEVLIVGDDDQALHKFKGADPRFIRGKHDPKNSDFESHTLRFCTRCPEVIVNAFHATVAAHAALIGERINKDYFYFSPEKALDSKLNPAIMFMELPPGMIAYRVREELKKMLSEQKIKSVLIIGEARSCGVTLSLVARGLKEYGFHNVSQPNIIDRPFTFKKDVINGYKVLAKGGNPVLGWRVLVQELEASERERLIRDGYSDGVKFVASIPEDFRKSHEAASATLHKILHSPKSARASISVKAIGHLSEQIVDSKVEDRELMMEQIIQEHRFLARPLANLDITVTNILGSKGLGADVVFLIGFDQGKLPAKIAVEEDEVYQMLVAITRAKKRLYLVSTKDRKPSSFKQCIDAKFITELS